MIKGHKDFIYACFYGEQYQSVNKGIVLYWSQSQGTGTLRNWVDDVSFREERKLRQLFIITQGIGYRGWEIQILLQDLPTSSVMLSKPIQISLIFYFIRYKIKGF